MQSLWAVPWVREGQSGRSKHYCLSHVNLTICKMTPLKLFTYTILIILTTIVEGGPTLILSVNTVLKINKATTFWQYSTSFAGVCQVSSEPKVAEAEIWMSLVSGVHGAFLSRGSCNMACYWACERLLIEKAALLIYLYFYWRDLEWHHSSGYKNSEAWDHVSRGLSAGGSSHEETAPWEVGAAVRCGFRGADLHRNWIHVQRCATGVSRVA